jgi:hypothetical protein
VDLSGLKPGTVYHFIAVSIDPSGNQGNSPDRTFATLNEDGTEVPLPPQPEPEAPVNANVPTNTNTPAETPADTGNSPSGRELPPEIGSSERIMSALADLLKEPELSILPEEPFVNTVNEIIDRVVRPPAIVGLKPDVSVAGTSAVIRWKTDKKANGVVSYVEESYYDRDSKQPYSYFASSEPGEYGINHSIEITNLQPATTYHFQVSSKGAVGGEARSEDMAFSTGSDLPVISDFKVTEIADTEAVLKWRTNVPTSTEARFKNISSGVELTQGDVAFLRDHSFSLKNLVAGLA